MKQKPSDTREPLYKHFQGDFQGHQDGGQEPIDSERWEENP